MVEVLAMEMGNGTGNGNGAERQKNGAPARPEKTPEQIAAEQQERFAQMRQQLLGHDAQWT